MSQAPPIPDLGVTMADLLERLGGISPARVRLRPTPGTATERDVLDIADHEDRLCELVDGVLVEKTLGYWESYLALRLAHFLQCFLDHHNLEFLVGESGMLRILPGRIRIPDISFISWARISNPDVLQVAVPNMAPDLAIEILSKGNTKREMKLKLREYFAAGSSLVWYIDPKRRVATVDTAPDECTVTGGDGSLDGGDVLPGFSIPLRQLFEKPAPPPAG